jgi:uncharacterized protein YutE (UPF0331/DUF86 family)/predicted nucleotidyltransferase
MENNLSCIIEIFKRHGVSFGYLFGSILLDEAIPQDIDLGVYIEKPSRYIMDYYTDIYFDLCDLFQADNIDLLMLNNTDIVFKYTVINTGKLIYFDDQDVLDNFIQDTIFLYEDTRGVRKESQAVLFETIREGFLMYKKALNLERIELFFRNMRNAIKKIILLRGKFNSLEEFLSEEFSDDRELCVHYLRLALEPVLDICRHIIAVRDYTIPDMEKENLIDVLGREKVLPKDFTKKIRGMQGMRNAIVHVYWNLDYEKIYQMITENLEDFEAFAKYILKFIEADEAH